MANSCTHDSFDFINRFQINTAGRLPAISHHEENATGEWAEFQPLPRSSIPKLTSPFPEHLRKLHSFNMGRGVAQAQHREHTAQGQPSQASQQSQGLAALLHGPSSCNQPQIPGQSSSHGPDTAAADSSDPGMSLGRDGQAGSSAQKEEAAPGGASSRGDRARQVACRLEPAVWFRFRSKEEAAEHRRELARRDCEAALQNGWSGDTVQVGATCLSKDHVFCIPM